MKRTRKRVKKHRGLLGSLVAWWQQVWQQLWQSWQGLWGDRRQAPAVSPVSAAKVPGKYTQPEGDTLSERSVARATPLPPSFVLGLEMLQDNETMSVERLLGNLNWDSESQVSESADALSAQGILQGVQWDDEPIGEETILQATAPLQTKPKLEMDDRFLIGIEGIVDVENLSSEDLLLLLNWDTDAIDGESIASDEDLKLLGDLLVDFPD